ncbi:hypothetical protein HTY54_18475 [Escherichia coli]|nr:hypothetical protein [Escherichia coli]
MDLSLLKALSEADAIASSEQEVRQILLEEADRLQKEVRFDGLGSVLIRLNESTGPKVMICAHMDEVGFMVRSISREGGDRCVAGWQCTHGCPPASVGAYHYP